MLQPFGDKLRSNTTWEWSASVPGYSSADGYTLKYFFRGTLGKFDVTGTADGAGGWSISVADETTKGYKPGFYSYLAIVEKDGKKFEVGSGGLQVLPDLQSADTFDGRTLNKKILDNLDAKLLDMSVRIEDEYEVFDRRLKVTDRTKLLELRDEYARRVQQELEESGQLPKKSTRIDVRMP